MSDTWACAGRELMRRKTRTATNLLGYLLTIGIMVALVHLLLFSKEAETEVLMNTGVHFMAISPLFNPELGPAPDASFATTKALLDPDGEAFLANSIVTRMLPLAKVEEVRKLDTVKDASPFLSFRFSDPRNGQFFVVGGFDPGNSEAVGTTCCAKSDLVAGSMLPEKTDPASIACMLDEAFAISRSIKVGQAFQVGDWNIPVIGIVNPGIRPAKADVYMAFEHAEKLINTRLKDPLNRETNVILVEVKSSAVQAKCIEDVKKAIQGSVITSYACFKPATKVMGINENAIWLLVAVIALGAILISLKSQITSVIERRRDIGILKALGWTNGDVIGQLMAESLLVSLSGGLGGCIAGALIFLLAPMKELAGIRGSLVPSLHPTVIFAGIVVALLGGVIAGVIPAWIAARQNPAEAMKRI